jgi:uncharacterized phiE125 gp8 family phage protein
MADFTTISDVKAYLGITSATDDALLTRLIAAASQWIRSNLNRDITSQAYTDKLDGTGTSRVILSQFPVTAVTSVTVDGTDQAASNIAFRDATVALTDGTKFTKGFANVVVTYTAGYATTPGDIAQACIELVAWRYKEKDRIGHASKTIAGEVVAFQTQDVPNDVKTLLNNWRKVVPV